MLTSWVGTETTIAFNFYSKDIDRHRQTRNTRSAAGVATRVGNIQRSIVMKSFYVMTAVVKKFCNSAGTVSVKSYSLKSVVCY